MKEKSSKYLTGAFAILCNGILKDQHQSCTATYIAATPNIHISANPDVRQNVQLPKLWKWRKTFQTALNFDEPQFIQESVFCSNCFFHFCSFHHKAAANLCIANFGNLFYEQRNFVSIVDFLTCHFQEGWTLKVF